MNTKYLVIYHKEDNDGIISAALVYYHLTKRMRVDGPSITMMPADYNTLNRLTDEEDTLNYFLYLECLSYTRNCANMINSNLKEETKIDLIVNEFVNGGIEEELYKSMYESN